MEIEERYRREVKRLGAFFGYPWEKISQKRNVNVAALGAKVRLANDQLKTR